MCIGTPMRVVAVAEYQAACEAHGETVTVDTALIDGALTPGDFILVHLARGIRKLSADEAAAIRDALAALNHATRGENFEHLIADLIDREPPLPDHLRAAMLRNGG